MRSPDLFTFEFVAQQLEVSVEAVRAAHREIGAPDEDGVHHSRVEPVRRVIVRWLREGNL